MTEPVYYVQYAHARIARRSWSGSARSGWRRRLRARMPDPDRRAGARRAGELVRELLSVPAEVAEAAERRAPRRIATDGRSKLAQAFAGLLAREPPSPGRPSPRR